MKPTDFADRWYNREYAKQQAWRDAETACEKGHGYSCDWRANMAQRESNSMDVSYWCRRAQDLNYYSGGPCSGFRPKGRR